MKITLDTREDKEEIRKVIRLLQQIVGDHSTVETSPSSDIFSSGTPAMNMFDEPKKEEVSPGVFNLFGDNPPESLRDDKDDDDDPEPIQIIDF